MQPITRPQLLPWWLMNRGQQPRPPTLGTVLAPSPAEQLETTYRQCSDRLLRFAATISGPSAAEDVLSTAVMKVLTSRNLEEISDFEKYLFRSVANVGRSLWRTTSRRSQREETFSRLTLPSSTPVHEIAADFSKEMLTLSPQQRAIVHLRYWEDMTTPVIANTLGISDGSVKRQLSRSLQKLRIEFADA